MRWNSHRHCWWGQEPETREVIGFRGNSPVILLNEHSNKTTLNDILLYPQILISTLLSPYQRSCFLQMVISIETHNWTMYRVKDIGCSVPNVMFVSHLSPQRLRDLCGTGGGKTLRATASKEITFSDTTDLMHIWTHSNGDIIYKTTKVQAR